MNEIKPKLFRVELSYNLVVLATSVEDAERNANYILRNEDDSEPETIVANSIITCDELPIWWDGHCIPWSTNRRLNPESKNITEILSANKLQ